MKYYKQFRLFIYRASLVSLTTFILLAPSYTYSEQREYRSDEIDVVSKVGHHVDVLIPSINCPGSAITVTSGNMPPGIDFSKSGRCSFKGIPRVPGTWIFEVYAHYNAPEGYCEDCTVYILTTVTFFIEE